MAWRVPTWKEWGDRTPEINKKERQHLFSKEEYDGILLYEINEPIGWCQLVKPINIPKLAKAVKDEDLINHYIISCFMLRPDKRGLGYGTKFLSLVVDHLLKSGISKIIGVPEKSGECNEEIWTGTNAMFMKAGFEPHPNFPQLFILRTPKNA